MQIAQRSVTPYQMQLAQERKARLARMQVVPPQPDEIVPPKVLKSGASRHDIASAKEAEFVEVLRVREEFRRSLVVPTYREAVEHVADLTHVSPDAILNCRTSTVTRATPLNAPAISARNLAIYIAHRAGMTNADIALASGVGRGSVQRIIDRMSSVCLGGSECHALINVAIANVSTFVLQQDPQ